MACAVWHWQGHWQCLCLMAHMALLHANMQLTPLRPCLQVFFGSWLLFPILFLMGPEGFGHLSVYGSIIAHTAADLLSKNVWGLLAHHLHNKVR